MKCTACSKFYVERLNSLKENAKMWITGTSNFKIDTIKSHESSAMHTDSVKASINIHKSEAGRAIKMLNVAEYAKLELRFRNAHAIAKHDKSFKDYVWLCKLDRAKGLDTGTTYGNDKAAKQFLCSISDVENDKTTSMLNSTHYFSLTIDGAMDVSGDEQESIYLYWSSKGVRFQRFLQFVSPESTSADDIFHAVMGVISDFKIDPQKLVGVTTDGASNMTGSKKGFCTLLKKQYPDIISTHCLAHRMELSVKDSIKDINNKLYDKTMTLLIGLYYFYKRSSKQKKLLVKAFKIHNMTCVIPTRVGGTRWVPHTVHAINIFLRGYIAVVSQLDTHHIQMQKLRDSQNWHMIIV